MQNKKQTIRKIVSGLNDDEFEGGGYWLPNIQRPFVWSQEQIGRLFDSIMREYPISTLLVWKTRESVKSRKFIDNYHADVKLSTFYVPENTKSKLMVLDGQQRLQSLYIGLKGSYLGNELHFNVLSGDLVAPEDIRFQFEFRSSSETSLPWIKFKEIVATTSKTSRQIAKDIVQKIPDLTNEQEERIYDNIERIVKEFVTDENVTYQELDGIDNPDAYTIDDIVEVFIRANSGGTKLGKSDLLFSLLSASWGEADGQMELLLEDLNAGDFNFDRDFVLKSCLCILQKGARYEVAKFRDTSVREDIIKNWDAISKSIKAVKDILISNTYIRSDKGLPSYLVLIPLIYLHYHFSRDFNSAKRIGDYLLRSLATSAFSGSPDNLIDKIISHLKTKNSDMENRPTCIWDTDEIFKIIKADGRSIEVSPELILSQHYSGRTTHLFFSLWYSSFNYSPAMTMNGPQVDHIFPQSLLKTIKDPNPESGRLNLLRYRQEDRDQIANCMLLTAQENGSGNKSATPPEEWFSDKDEAYLDMHLIPKDPELWKLENYENFIEARKSLILAKFDFMIGK